MRPSVRAVLSLLALVLLAGCAPRITTRLVPPADIATLDSRSPYLKAHRADGGVYVLSAWRSDSTGIAILGTGSLLNAHRIVVESGEFRVAAEEVVLFETNVESPTGAKTALTVMAGVTAAVTAVCVASPKTCFGSCPTFYAPDAGGGMSLQAEAFSSSIAPALEATDVDLLLHTVATDRDYRLRVTNEALETHVVRHADLLAAARPEGGRVHVTSDGRFRETTSARAPSRATAAEGDCLAALRNADGAERTSATDPEDLAAREVIDLEFDEVPDGELGLVIVSRQTLVTTFLIYQALAYLGDDAGRFLASLETGGEAARDRARSLGRVLGGIEVLVEDADGQWIPAGRVGETGPIAADTRVVPLPARPVAPPAVAAGAAGAGPTAPGAPFRVRLRLTQGLWRLDQAALVSLGPEVVPTRVRPAGVLRDGEPVPEALRALLDPAETLVTLPGDEYEITYRLPERPDAHELFLEARGYYLEWMREEWRAEQNPLAAARMVLDPAGAMRALAPAFKKEEPRIEHLFWNSRYARD